MTEDLWGDSESCCSIVFGLYTHSPLIAELEEKTELISDLAIASFDPSIRPKVTLDSLCPHHGRTCKKGLCEWRAEYEKKKVREYGYPTGPSNTKNYNQRPRNGRCRLSGTLTVFSSCYHKVVMVPAMAGLRRLRQRQKRPTRAVVPVPVVAQLLRLMHGVAGDRHSPPIDHRRRHRHLARGMELAAEDNLSGLQLVVAGRPEIPAVVYS